MTKKPSKIVRSIEVSAIKRFQILIEKEKGSISLAQGVPDFETPSFIKEKAKEAIDKGFASRYTKGWGIESLRQAIAEKMRKDNKIKAEPENVLLTHGAIEASMATLLALLDPEDEVIVLSPNYVSHINQIRIVKQGAMPSFVSLDEKENRWQLNPEKIESAVSKKTKAILFSNPSNPLGKVYSREELKAIAKIALKHNLFIIADEVYEYFVFDGKKHISIGSFPEAEDRTISIFSLSKSYSMTGWRIGYLVSDKKIVQEIFKIHDCLITCPVALSQYAALAAIKDGYKFIKKFKQNYERRRKIAIEILSRTDKLTLIKPEGTFYLFPKINLKMDDYNFSLRLLKEAKVGVVPGSAFGPGGKRHIRISFGGEEKKLKEGLERMVNYVKRL